MTYKVFQVPRAGVEPARVAPLVFETSASTDSAIWAFAVAKVRHFCETAKHLAYFLLMCLNWSIFFRSILILCLHKILHCIVEICYLCRGNVTNQ